MTDSIDGMANDLISHEKTAANRGLFISFEGVDGCGKSTQARLLTEALRRAGLKVTLTREPGGSPGAEEIRRLLLEGATERWSSETEILLFTAARRDHVEKVIRPALLLGHVVITDRFADSTRVYQGIRDEKIKREYLVNAVEVLHNMMIGIEPDLTYLIDLDPRIGLTRAAARGGKETRFEDMGLALQQKMRGAYLGIANYNPGRFRMIDGDAEIGQVEHEIFESVVEFMTDKRYSMIRGKV